MTHLGPLAVPDSRQARTFDLHRGLGHIDVIIVQRGEPAVGLDNIFCLDHDINPSARRSDPPLEASA